MRIFVVLFVVSLIKAKLLQYSGPCRHQLNETVYLTNQTEVKLTCRPHKTYIIWFFENTSFAVSNTHCNDGVELPNNLSSGLSYNTRRAKLILYNPFVEGTYQCQSGPCFHSFTLVNVTGSSTAAPETNLPSDTIKPCFGGELRLPPSQEGVSPYEVVGYLILGVVLGGCIAVLAQLPCWVEIKIFICWVRHCGEEL
ncbi:E3 CR1-alpha [Human mastadenovirus D]|uniref:21.8kDa protein n=5 Tax=Human mastadenovirus D TaxID=130310 RepID=I0FX51_9ADEN|nr:21.8 kDa [Human adenovirus D37]ACI47068.1 E3 21.8 kDa protein [Human adenovirus 64]AGT76593.1 E3 CR1-alpha [Human mastadenovirus D]BAH18971.1 21.8kDa protein [Human adenovirus 19]BAX64755.1 CR1 alpha protein [Human adenovirus] [Human adenovirus sp.]BBE38306.1 20.1kDa protein [Human adenovirus 19a]